VGHQQSIKGGLDSSFGLPGKFYSIISNDGRNNFLSEQLTVTNLVNKYDLLLKLSSNYILRFNSIFKLPYNLDKEPKLVCSKDFHGAENGDHLYDF
jgi:hypothetical protein